MGTTKLFRVWDGHSRIAVEFLQWLQMQCIKHPKATVLV